MMSWGFLPPQVQWVLGKSLEEGPPASGVLGPGDFSVLFGPRASTILAQTLCLVYCFRSWIILEWLLPFHWGPGTAGPRGALNQVLSCPSLSSMAVPALGKQVWLVIPEYEQACVSYAGRIIVGILFKLLFVCFNFVVNFNCILY